VVVVLAAASVAGLLIWSPWAAAKPSAPAGPRTVSVGANGYQASQFGGPSILPLTDANLALTTPQGQERPSGQTLPWERTITVQVGDVVYMSVYSSKATWLECRIRIDGNVIVKQEINGAGTVTCRAQL
jgi:4-amino-4-deoxy-L-arabinose transferase-like glycosyltransferase